jgi:hypothetical protein
LLSFSAVIACVVLAFSAIGADARAGGPTFIDVTASAGLKFTHVNGAFGKKYLPETMGSGCAFLDADGDGWQDILLVNSTTWRGRPASRATMALYRNNGNGTFTDVTARAGLALPLYGMGIAAADYDNDGDVDIYVTALGPNRLFRNLGGLKFEEVSAGAGVGDPGFSTSAVWVDYDRDGRLDLYVANYVQWSIERDLFCTLDGHTKSYCTPESYKGQSPSLYRNRGDGTFEDVSTRAGLSGHAGKGMSAAFADYDHDGRLDIFVTNDAVPDFLFRNNGDGTFAESALLAGVSVPDSGRPTSSMGVDFQDYDNDGWEDLHLTALTGETFPLFRNESAATRGIFAEVTQPSGLAALTVKSSGWCSVVADIDNDGWKDIFTANSHVNDRIGDFEAVDFEQPNSLFINDGRGRFRDATAASGLAGAAAAHRGCGVADFNADGRLDVVVLVLGGPAELWQNESAPAARWLIVRLIGTRSNRDGIGARVSVGNQVRTMTTAIGYASSSHAGLHFGLGSAPDVPLVEVRWPAGTTQRLEHVKTNQVLEIREQ